jgi:beta-xylosidase
MAGMHTNRDIHIRDPFVVPDPAEGKYYLFGTTGADCWSGTPTGFDVWVGPDLEHWEGPFPAFRPPAGFWADRNFWAPEVHPYRGRYYMFASFKSEEARRGTQILAADALIGPYAPHSDGPVTPSAWECLDGTLHVDGQGDPWIVFCHEWVQVRDGEMCAMRLAPDLSRPVSAPELLFHASDAPWVLGLEGQKDYVTDGPYLVTAANGELLMLWSSFSKTGYTLGTARSTGGGILGPWQQDAEPLYRDDGGHGMLFKDFAGQLRLAVHKPNLSPEERPIFVPIRDQDGRLSLL